MATTSFPACRFADTPGVPSPSSGDSSPVHLPSFAEAAPIFGESFQAAVRDALDAGTSEDTGREPGEEFGYTGNWPFAATVTAPAQPFSWDPVLSFIAPPAADPGAESGDGQSSATSASSAATQSSPGLNRSSAVGRLAPPAIATGQLAFELRFEPKAGAAEDHDSTQPTTSQASSPKPAAGASEPLQKARIELVQPAGQAAHAAVLPNAWQSTSIHQDAAPEPPASPAAVEPAIEVRTESEARVSEAPLREIAWSIKDSGQSAHVRLVDRAGEVVVSVRTPNQELLQPLRSGLNDLLHQLQGDGLAVEASLPDSAAGDRGQDPSQDEPAWTSRGVQYQAAGDRGRQPRRQQQIETEDER
jgi:hypothetical protein